jgi:ABC-2 type transport system ATP-binding protein
VTLDGREHTLTWSLEDVVYTVGAGDSLTLQITSSAVNYENFTTVGLINISDLRLDLPIRAQGGAPAQA